MLISYKCSSSELWMCKRTFSLVTLQKSHNDRSVIGISNKSLLGKNTKTKTSKAFFNLISNAKTNQKTNKL
jgi:hypothetical protein